MYCKDFKSRQQNHLKAKELNSTWNNSSAMAVPHNTKGVGHLQAKSWTTLFWITTRKKSKWWRRGHPWKCFWSGKGYNWRFSRWLLKVSRLCTTSPLDISHPSLKNANCVQACAHQDWVSVSQVHAWKHMVTVLSRQLLCASGTPYLPFFTVQMTLRKFKAGLKHNFSSKYVINMMTIGEPRTSECKC